jgi:uncharacterized protein YcnI
MTRTVVLATVAIGALVLAGSASAHAVMSPPVAKAKVEQQFTLSVPTEKAGALTTKVEMSIPNGVAIDSFEPAPGWTRDFQVGVAVTWRGGKVATGEDAVFRFDASLDTAKTFTFLVRQTYSDGSVVNWTGPETSDTPAPRIDGVSSLGGGGTSTLEIVALIVGGAGVLLGILALATRGRPLA